jgi:outer membrane protein assembly factor BamE (lipoprotein component of BamABCDE complex)
MIDVAPDQTVRQVQQVLSEPYFSRVRAGMSREEVRKLLGRPKEVWYFPMRDEEVWTWRYLDNQYKFFNVMFDRTEGTVKTTLRLDEIFGGRGGQH